MGCCVGANHSNWCEKYGIVYIDAEGKEYCIFHAPADCKFVELYDERDGGDKPDLMDAKHFNGLVFERIDAVIEAGVDEERDEWDLTQVFMKIWNPRCNFSNTIFPFDISFLKYSSKRTHYIPTINFTDSQFEKRADFSNACFSGIAYFNGSHFKGPANFNDSQFEGEAHFSHTVFYMSTDFLGTIFGRSTLFEFAEFHEQTIFEGSKSPKINFRNASALQKIHLNKTTFSDATFDQMEFMHFVFFNDSSFTKQTSFKGTIFHDYSNFELTKFQGGADFHLAFFKEWAYFRKASFDKETTFAGAISKESILLESVDLSNLKFAETNIESFKFTECTWPRKKNGRRAIADEISPIDSENGLSFTKLEERYRRLKKVARVNNDEMQASTWHYNEKEMLRKKMREENGPGIIEKLGTKTCELLPCNIEIAKTKFSKLIEISEQTRTPFLRFINTAYWIVSGYGEEPLRAGVWLLIFIFGAMLLAIFGPDSTSSDFSTRWMWYMPLIKVNLKADGLHYLLKGLSVTLITLQAALFGFALRNKLRR